MNVMRSDYRHMLIGLLYRLTRCKTSLMVIETHGGCIDYENTLGGLAEHLFGHWAVSFPT